MEAFSICGGRPLSGEIRAYGAKNAVLPIMAASVLAGSETVLHNVPDLKDVKTPLLCSFFSGYGAIADKLNEIAAQKQ